MLIVMNNKDEKRGPRVPFSASGNVKSTHVKMQVQKYLEGITEAFNYPSLVGADSADREKGDYYNPAMADRLAQVKELAAGIRELYKSHTDMGNRVQQIY